MMVSEMLQAFFTEALVCMLVAKKAVSFAATEDLINILKTAVDDSDIMRAVKLSHTKISYVLRNGLHPHFKEQLIQDLSTSAKKNRVVICFDETTNSQTSSQLDFFCQYWSCDSDQVVIRYLGSYFLGRKPADVLNEKLHLVLSEYKLEPNQVIDISRDNCTTNESLVSDFKNKLQERESSRDPVFTNIGGCHLHKAYNSFKVFLKHFQIDGCNVIEFSSDVNMFFCNSSARKEEFKVGIYISIGQYWFILVYFWFILAYIG
jgi:hypothetical protein